MSSKINILEILSSHGKTLCNYGTGSISILDYFFHFGIPLALGLFLGKHLPLSDQMTALLINIYAILIGLLLTVIAVLFSFLDKLESSRRRVARKQNPEKADFSAVKWREKLIKEIFSNILFSILVSVPSILLLLFLYNKTEILPLLSFVSKNMLDWIIYFANAIAWADVFMHGILVLMILKRMHALFIKEINEIEKINMNEF